MLCVPARSINPAASSVKEIRPPATGSVARFAALGVLKMGWSRSPRNRNTAFTPYIAAPVPVCLTKNENDPKLIGPEEIESKMDVLFELAARNGKSLAWLKRKVPRGSAVS